jgi:hypothetical protein
MRAKAAKKIQAIHPYVTDEEVSIFICEVSAFSYGHHH